VSQFANEVWTYLKEEVESSLPDTVSLSPAMWSYDDLVSCP
jgi:hypothetical protein